MKSPTWLRKLFASPAARRMPYRKPRRPEARPGVDLLEDRIVPSSATQTFAPSTAATQFTNVSNTTFLGASFNQSASFGSIDSTVIGDFGAQVNVSLAGQAGLNLTFTGTGGTVSPSYGATLNQSFTQPTAFGQLVSFNPLNTNVAINSGSVTTSTPSFGYGADVVASLNGSLGGEFALFQDFSPSPFTFGGSMDIPLFAVNENGDGILSVGGVPIFGASDGLGLPDFVQAGLKEAQDFALGKSLEYGISEDPPLKIATDFEADANSFTQDLKLELGLAKKPGASVVSKALQKLAGASMDLGSLTEEAPQIAVDSGGSTLQAGGVVTATASGTIAQLNLQVGALAASLLGLAALGTTDEIKLGPANVQFTPVSFQLQPTLTAVQTLTLQPESLLTYTFTDSGGKSAAPDVILDGRDLGHVSSVTFVPGQDTVQIPFEGSAITVTPSWEFKEVLTNEVDLDADLNATLTVGQITVNIPTLDPITAGPLYQQQFQFANSKLMTLLDQTSTVFDQTVTSIPGDASTPQSFTIGQNFPLSTVVTTTADSAVAGSGSLRTAVSSANVAAGTNVIQLGAGTYQLTLAPAATDGSSGNLLVTQGNNLIIQGAGAGQTIIRANFPSGTTDRLFDVASGASLTLDGLTLEDGDATNSQVDAGEGGAILAGAGSTLDVESCVITDNNAGDLPGPQSLMLPAPGGAIMSSGAVTINNSTISDNSAFGSGGGIEVIGGSLLLQNSTVSGNTVGGAYAGGFASDVTGNGGGLSLVNSSATIDNSTFSSNEIINAPAAAEGGAISINNFSGTNNVLIDNSTLSGNQAAGALGSALGGAIFDHNAGGLLYLVADTIASNTAGTGAAIFTGLGNIVTPQPEVVILKNTIVAGDLVATIGSLGNNLIQAPGTNAAKHNFTISNGSLVNSSGGFDPTDVLNQDPQLAALANNGGPTQTMALGTNSPALGKGGTSVNIPGVITQLPTTDQRGYARSVGGRVDIGALEEQYDLAVTGGVSGGGNGSALTYTFTVTNNGPDAAPSAAFTDTFPSNVTVGMVTAPGGWVAAPSFNFVPINHIGPLPAGQTATFTVTATPTSQLRQTLLDTATVTPNGNDTDAVNNSATVVVQPATEGQSLQNALLYHFQSPNPADVAANFSASVSWGDGGPGNNSLDGTGTVSVVADANGGFDVFGSHLYADEGNYNVSVNVTDLQGGTVQATLSGQTTPIIDALAAPVPTPGGQLTNMVLMHFADSNPADTPATFSALVTWGDGTFGGTGNGLSIVADPAGGFDVVGSHTFASNVVGAVNDIQVNRGFSPPVPLTAGPSMLHIAGALPGSADHFAVTWGDGTSNTTSGPHGSSQVSVSRNPAGGYDLIGEHVYTQDVATFSGSAVVAVADAPLTAGAATPPAVFPQTQLSRALLFHFVDPDSTLTASSMKAIVQWGDFNANSSGDGSVSVVADQAGGFDVFGSHIYPAGVGGMPSVKVTDSDGRVFFGPVLFHFTDADPLATASDFTATVNWGDGSSNTSADGLGFVSVVADPAGGFDVVGSHFYTQNTRNGTFSVSVADDGGASASAHTSFSVDYPLTAGTLTLPAVNTEGDSISKALLFHFTDGDPQGQASDFTATVFWADGSSNTSADKTGTVTVSANSNGGFDVFGSHTFDAVPSGSTFAVLIQDESGATTGASSTSFTVADPSVKATGGLTLKDSKNADPGAQTVATFTDPAGAEDLSDYSASIHWGDGTPDTSGTITYNSTTKTFTVTGDHAYSQANSDTITVTISHDESTPVQVTDTASVADVAASVTGSFQISTVYGQSTGTQWVATFDDPGGASPLSEYQPTISWGDNTTSTGTIGFDKSAPFTFASNVQTGNGPSAVAVADLNGDGNLDLVVANAIDNDVQVFLGNGDGSFQSPVSYSLGTASPTALVVADLGNGDLDIVTANSNTNTVSVLLGNGDGTFQKNPTTLTAGANPSAVALADLGNSHVDIVTANRGDNTVSVFVGNGDGTFKAAVNYKAGTSPDGVAIGDVNGDGKADVVVADADSDSVSILLGNGDGTLQAATAVAVGSVPSAVALAHLTGSGHLDIVTANSGDNTVSVLLGNGDGTFRKAVSYAVGSAPTALLVTDANGDGNQDVITANNGDNDVSVLMGNGDGTFQAQTTYALASGATAPNAIAVGDLNGAGVPDLVTANSLSNNVTLLLPPYKVTGSHTYSAVSAANTPYQVTVTVAHGTTSASANTGTVAVTPAPLSITANDQTMTYGGTMPTLTAKFDGLVNGDQPSAVNGLTLTTVAASSHVGSYTISASGGTDSNYTITLHNGTLKITPAALCITADNKTMPYGGTLPALTVSYNGLVNGDTPATFATSPNTAPTVGTTATANSHVSSSPYAVTAAGASDSDYTISYVAGGLTVTPVALTITADSKTMTYGGQFPALTASYSGLVNGDTPATFATSPNSAPTVSTTATASSSVSKTPYAITAAGASDSDYTISYVAGGLTVMPAALTISADNKTMPFGGPIPALTVTYNGLVNGDTPATFSVSPNTAPTVTTTAKPTSAVGPYQITAGGASDANYTIQYAPGTLTVVSVQATLAWAAPQPIASFTALTGVQLDASANVPGTFSYTPPAGTLLAPGTQTLSVSFTPSDGADYTSATTSVPITVLGPGSVTVIGTQLYIVGGNNSNDQVQVQPAGSANTGGTGVQVQTMLNGVHIQTTYSQSFTAINVLLQGGNDNVQFANTLTLGGVVSAGNGHDNIQLAQGNNSVTLGWGNDNVQLGNGNNTVALDVGKPPSSPTPPSPAPPPPAPPPGNDNVQLGNGNNTVTAGGGNVTVNMGYGSNSITLGNGNDTVQANNPPPPPPGTPSAPAVYGNNVVTLGNGNDNVTLGDGNNVLVEGNGNDNVHAGNGDNLIVAGLGQHTVQVGNGSNILIDGAVTLSQGGDSLTQVLNDWVAHGASAANVASIRSRLVVTYNTSHANTIQAGGGVDWFWATYAKTTTNRKRTDLLN
jgi:hypothetical protein